MSSKSSWHPKVYGGKTEKRKNMCGNLKRHYAKQFKYTCQACRKRFSLRSLNLHHIIPRSMGGDEEPSNLILLCCGCHDKIEQEWQNYKSYADICYAFVKRRHKDIVIRKKEAGTDWHEWVYGGKRNPANG